MRGKLVAVVVLVTALAGGGGADPVTRQAAEVAPGESHGFPLAVAPGSYVTGRLISPGHPFDLDLVTAGGASVRHLLTDSAGAGAFHLVTEGAGLMLRARNAGTTGAAAVLNLDRVVPPEALGARPEKLVSPTMAALADHLATGGDTEAFWAVRAAEGTPMIEPSDQPGEVIATFLWRGARHNARLWGGPAVDHLWMERLGQSDVWFTTLRVPLDARVSYGVAPDVPQFDGPDRANRVALLATLQADPLNRHPIFAEAPDPWAQRSQLVLPGAPEQPGMTGPIPQRRGEVARLSISSDRLGRDRRIDVYRPAGFDPAAPDTLLLILFDGPAYQRDLAPVPLILDRLIAAGRLPPVVALLIDPIDNDQRGRDLTCNPDFTDALADELVPQIAARLGLVPDRARTVIAGSSYGGLASAFAVRRRPEVFGNAVVLSGSFWWAPEGEEGQGMPYMSSLWAEGPLPDVRLWMSAGTYEAGREPGAVSILETTRHLRDVLRIRGADVTYRQYSGGHDYLVWRGALAEGLLHLFGRE